ncbi:MAG TPA: SDR family NAD(P)-dependent oxidoreductase [Pseudonocardiaceae bacterium]|nr:SDR family NAD(P)-dependent oxidoreductase [Pseudonocardiaceae bacterium]
MSNAVLITGCSSGIGRAIAHAALKAGLPTWATARKPEVVADLAEAGANILALDVTDETSRQEAVRRVEAEHGSVGALINNAGYAQAGPVEEVPIDALRAQFETNVFGLVRLCQLVLPGMRERGRGTIVNLGSAGGLMAFPGSSAYDMTKWSLEALSDALRAEVHRFGVRVVLLEPGGVPTNFAAVQAATWPDSSNGPYAAFASNYHARMARYAREGAPGMSTPDKVAAVAMRAVQVRNPRARYKIGMPPRIMPLLHRALPNRTLDALVGRLFPMD